MLFLVINNTVDPILYGLGLLEREPIAFKCRKDESVDVWEDCTKKHICSEKLSTDHFKFVHDEDFLTNWVSPDKFNLLCEPKYKVGLLGSFFFAGVVSSMLTVPRLADRYGRRSVNLIVALILTFVCQLGLLVTTNLEWAYFF